MIRGVYLAYPIDQRGPASLTSLFEQVEQCKTDLIDGNLADWVFDPGDAFRVSKQPGGGGVATINRAALNNADLVVAFLPAGVASIGVPMEIDRARAQGKHVMVFSDAASYMLEMPSIARANEYVGDIRHEFLEWVDSLDVPQVSKQFSDLPFLVEAGGQLPKRKYDDDAGLDLFVSQTTKIGPGAFQDLPSAVSCELPPHTWGLVTGRSSAFRKRGLLVLPGVIDAGYRGELFAGVWNSKDEAVWVERGERIAQLIVIGNSTRYLTPVQVEGLSDSPRGVRGFGSSGA